jgi:hypothetical protein
VSTVVSEGKREGLSISITCTSIVVQCSSVACSSAVQ